MFEITGGSLTGVTVSANDEVATPNCASWTVIVMIPEPLWLTAGVMMTVRLAPLPPKTIFCAGTSKGLEQEPFKVRLAGAVCASPMVKAIGPTAVSSGVVRLVMAEIVGAVLAIDL